jgi:hypothetical protein
VGRVCGGGGVDIKLTVNVMMLAHLGSPPAEMEHRHVTQIEWASRVCEGEGKGGGDTRILVW